jgi:hypothetical protein
MSVGSYKKRNWTPIEDFSPGRELWERQKGESRQAFSAFDGYLRMAYEGDERQHRSLRRLSEARGHDSSLFGRWSIKWRWVERVGAWDRHLDSLARTRLEDMVLELHRKRLSTARQMVNVVSDGMETLKGEELSVPSLTKLSDSSVKLGDVGKVVEATPSGMSDGALETVVVAIARKREGRSVTD